jgi:hypothetical protein
MNDKSKKMFIAIMAVGVIIIIIQLVMIIKKNS